MCRVKKHVSIEQNGIYYPLVISMEKKYGIMVCIQTGDDNLPAWFDLSGFEVIDQKIPSSWVIKKYGDEQEGMTSLMPASWTYPGFFEDLHDDDEKARKLFNYEAVKIYEEMGAPGYDKN